MSKFADELKQSLLEAIDIAKGKMDKSRYQVYTPADLPDTVDIKSIRQKLNMSQATFSATFGLATDSVKNWEQGRRRPDRAVRAYLTVIQRNPEAVISALRP